MVRTDNWRYIEWVTSPSNNKPSWQLNWNLNFSNWTYDNVVNDNNILAIELYDHRNKTNINKYNCYDRYNLAYNQSMNNIVASLHKIVYNQWTSDDQHMQIIAIEHGEIPDSGIVNGVTGVTNAPKSTAVNSTLATSTSVSSTAVSSTAASTTVASITESNTTTASTTAAVSSTASSRAPNTTQTRGESLRSEEEMTSINTAKDKNELNINAVIVSMPFLGGLILGVCLTITVVVRQKKTTKKKSYSKVNQHDKDDPDD